MSSFDITNINSFNDLINRADFLTEMADSAKKAIAQLAKTKDGKVGLNDLIKMYQHKTKGTSPAASYAKNMLWLVAMAEQDFITDEQKESIKKTTNMGSSTAFAKAVQEVAPEATEALYGKEQKSEDLKKFIGDNSIVLLRRAIMNMPGDNFIYIGPDVEDKELDAAVSSQKVEDDIEDVADDMESRFEKGVLRGIRGGVDYEKEIQDLPFDDVDVSLEELENKDEIAAKIVELINTTDNLTAEVTPIGFNIEGPVGVFVDSETITDQMNRLITKYFPNVRGRDIPVRLNTSVGEDNEFDDFDIGPQSDENAPDDYEEVLKAMITKDKEQFAKNMIEDEEKAKEDYDGDGEVETSTQEWKGSRDKAIKRARGSMKESKEYVAQPHLEVSETSTAAYLTEQTASDKRNKKTEIKNQSFKERYKPKTQWQLEELRRYGL